MTRDTSIEAARHAARNADDAKVIRLLRDYADDLEAEGRGHVPQWMREAADRIDRQSARIAALECAVREQAAQAAPQIVKLPEVSTTIG